MFIEPTATKPFEETFHAHDMARKWIIGAGFGVKSMCTPIIGAPRLYFKGFLQSDSVTFKAKQAYLFLKQLLPNISANITNLSTREVYHFKWADEKIDIVWKKALQDSDTSTLDFDLSLYDVDYLINALGEPLTAPVSNIFALGQEPLIIKEQTNATGPNSILAYPNPFEDQLTIVVFGELTDDKEIKIFDLLGNLVFSQNITVAQDEYNFPMDNLGKGMYIVTLTDSSGERIDSPQVIVRL